jgi:hypothetical protein
MASEQQNAIQIWQMQSLLPVAAKIETALRASGPARLVSDNVCTTSSPPAVALTLRFQSLTKHQTWKNGDIHISGLLTQPGNTGGQLQKAS